MAGTIDSGPPYRLRVFINYKLWGWSEVYWLTATNLADALEWGYEICNRRRLWFGVGPTFVYACIGRGDSCQDTWAIDVSQINAFPPSPWPLPQPPNSRTCGWLYREEAGYAAFGQRIFRGVPDDWIQDVRAGRTGGILFPLLTPSLPVMSLGTPLAPGQLPPVVSSSSLQTLQRSFLDALLLYGGFCRRNPGGENAWTVLPLRRVLYRVVSNQVVGGGWDLVSCEPGLSCVGGFRLGPLFSFCGQVVGCCHTCYYAPCRWYVDGPVMGIRFYRTAPGTPLYLGQCRFGPKISEPGYVNGPRTGEITSNPRDANRPWYNGANQVAGRDGTHPAITPQEAAGQEPWPWPGLPIVTESKRSAPKVANLPSA